MKQLIRMAFIYAIAGLVGGLAGRVRVNAIAPGWIDPTEADHLESDERQQPVGRIGRASDISSLVRYLFSDEAGFITGETITIDGGMSRMMIYHGDHGWSYVPKSAKSSD